MLDLTDFKLKPHLSVSAVSDYLDCGLIYKFSRIDKIMPEFQPDALEFGSAVHLTLADFYRQKLLGNNLTLKDVQETFEAFWRERAEDNLHIQYAEGKDFESFLREGKELLAVWFSKVPENSFKVLGIEEPFILTLPDLSVPIIGYIDLLEEDESGNIIVTDWKTSGRAYSNEEINKNLQLTVYGLAVKENGYQEREILLKFDCLIKTKNPKFEQFWTVRDDLEEKKALRRIREVWRGIVKEVFLPAHDLWKCKNCGYKNACEDWFKGGQDA
jgi:putative RecB family exonuclease